MIGALAFRDIRARLRDRSALIVAFVAPLALMIVLSALSAGPSRKGLKVGFVADDAAPVSAALRQGALAQLEKDGTIKLVSYDDVATLRAAVDDDQVRAGIAVLASTGEASTVEIIRGTNGVVANVIAEAASRDAAAATSAIGRAVAAETILGSSDAAASTGSVRIASALTSSEPTARLIDVPSSVGGISAKTETAIGMAVFFLFFTVQFGLLGLLQERREGTLPRLLVAPIKPWKILASKVLVSFTLGIGAMVSLVVASTVLFGAKWGPPLGVLVLLASAVTAAVATITLVVGVARTAEQAGSAQSMVALVLGILGGSFFSMSRSGGITAVLTRLTPHFWLREGLVRLSGGHALSSITGPVLAMLLFAAVFGLPGLALASRTVRP